MSLSDTVISGGIFLLWVALAAYALAGVSFAEAVYLCAVMLLSLAMNTLLKAAFRKSRPGVQKRSIFYPGAQRYSFPSAHVQLAFTALALIKTFFPSLLPEALFLAVATLVSRLYLGKHWLTDVVAGAALGYALGSVAAWLWQALS